MSREFVVSGEMSADLRAVIPPGETVVAFTRTAAPLRAFTGSNLMIVFWVLMVVFTMGMILPVMLGVYLFMPVHEHAVTGKHFITGQKTVIGGFTYKIIPLRQISAVRVSKDLSIVGRAQMEIIHAGGTVELPVLGGPSGQKLFFSLTQLVQQV